MGEWGFVVAGYATTLAVLAGYVASLLRRARRAREHAAAVVEERST